jgi:hypothetical protein
MDQQNSHEKSTAARTAKMRSQRERIIKAIEKAESEGLFELVFFEEMFEDNKTYFRNHGYIVKNFGGPQNTNFSMLDWSM